MKLVRQLAVASIILYSASSSAASQDIVLNNIEVWSNANGNNIIRVMSPGQPIVNNWGCSDPDSYMVLSSIAKEAQARIYATLLAAKAMGKPITIRVEGCEFSRPAILNVNF